MTWVFWCCLSALVYAFAVYPLLLRLGTRRGPGVTPSADLPRVSVLLSVYNEERVIQAKIQNFLALDYPADRRELLVVSDASDDGTDDLARGWSGTGVRLLRQQTRGGKTRALNRAAAEATGEILVFTDANSMFRPDCLRALIEPLADPGVGLVSGRSLYVDAAGRETLGGVYRRYEEWIKDGESRLFSIVGADGAVYALRRALFTELRPEYINDLLHPMQVVLRGLRAVSAPDAVVIETGEDDAGAESRRQTRIMAQSWLVCLRHLGVLVRAGKVGFVWQLVSHKLLRWLTLPLMVGLGAAALVRGGALSVLILAAEAGLAGLAWRGARGGKGPARAAWMFVVLHWAALAGLYRLGRGETYVTWNPRQG